MSEQIFNGNPFLWIFFQTFYHHIDDIDVLRLKTHIWTNNFFFTGDSLPFLCGISQVRVWCLSIHHIVLLKEGGLFQKMVANRSSLNSLVSGLACHAADPGSTEHRGKNNFRFVFNVGPRPRASFCFIYFFFWQFPSTNLSGYGVHTLLKDTSFK